MRLTLVTPPAVEPVSVSELKDHLRIDSGDLAAALEVEQTILAGSHGIIAAYGLVGLTVDVLGYSVLTILAAGTCGGGATVYVKLQDSANGIAWVDVAGGAFVNVTPANDEATYELAYAGGKHYLRAVSTVVGAACEFGVSFILRSPVSLEDAVLSGFVTAARQYCEGRQNRVYITQIWELALDEWPEIIDVPLPPLQTVDKIEYYGSDGVMLPVLDPLTYQVDERGYRARVAPVYGQHWPILPLRTLSGIIVTFTAGYGIATDVPERIRTAIKLLAGHLYEHREATDIKEVKEVAFAVNALLGIDSVGII